MNLVIQGTSGVDGNDMHVYVDDDLEGPVMPPSMAEIRGEERDEEKERGHEIYTVYGKRSI